MYAESLAGGDVDEIEGGEQPRVTYGLHAMAASTARSSA
jgi:hypothetical protein